MNRRKPPLLWRRGIPCGALLISVGVFFFVMNLGSAMESLSGNAKE